MSQKDYYSILSIPRDASLAEIRKAYHRKALQFHPDKNTSDPSYFCLISEAYDVLSSVTKRRIFDSHGEDGLREKCNYIFKMDLARLFSELCGETDLLQRHDCRVKKRPAFDKFYRGPVENRPKDKEVIKELALTLEELHTGLTKRIKITKKIESERSKFRVVERILEIKVRPGWKDGTRITFEREGNVNSETIPADIVFVIREKPHPIFERVGDDLVYHVTLSLQRSLTGTTISVPLIDSTSPLDVRLPPLVAPGTTKVLPSHGIQSQRDAAKRGDLILKFSVNYPTSLSEQQIKALRRILPED